MRIKTRYLLLVPLIITALIAMVNTTIVLINNEKVKYKLSAWEEFGIFCYMLTGLFIIIFIIMWFYENWDEDFYINLRFKNKSRES